MQAFFHFLAVNPYILLFVAVGLAVWIGRQTIGGYGLGMVAAAIIVGCGLSVWASSYGEKLELNNFTKSLFYYLFMYGVGLRVGPSFLNGLGADGIRYTVLAVVSCVIGLAIVVIGARVLELPPGAAGGMLAGSQTMSAAIGSAEQACSQIAAWQHARAGVGDDRPRLWNNLHLGHGRHHPHYQVPAELVGNRCTRGGERIRKEARRRFWRFAGAVRLDTRELTRLSP